MGNLFSKKSKNNSEVKSSDITESEPVNDQPIDATVDSTKTDDQIKTDVQTKTDVQIKTDDQTKPEQVKNESD